MLRRERELLEWALGELKPHVGSVALDGGLYLVGLALGVVQPLIFSRLVDFGLVAGDYRLTLYYIVLMTGCTLGAVALGTLRTRLQAWFSSQATIRLRSRHFKAMASEASLVHRTDYDPGDEAAVLLEDIRGVAQQLLSLPITLLNPVFVVLGFGVVLWTLSPVLLLVTVALSPFQVVWYSVRTPVLRQKLQELRKTYGEYSGFAHFLLEKLREIVALRLNRDLVRRHEEWVEQVGRLNIGVAYFETATSLGVSIIGSLTTVLIWGYGGYLVVGGTLTLGTMMAFWSYSGRLIGGLQELVSLPNRLQPAFSRMERACGSFQRWEDSAGYPPTCSSQDPPGQYEPVTEVTLTNLTLGYAGAVVLDNLSIAFDSKQLHWVVGPSGSGKTTLGLAVSGLLAPLNGEVLYDGAAGEHLNGAARKRVYLNHKPILMAGTVIENLLLGTRLSAKQAERILTERGFDQVMSHLHLSYSTPVRAFGSNLSSGQQQAVSIGRLLLQPPDVAVLDECFANLDIASKRLFVKIVQQSLHGRIVVLITHDFRSIAPESRIITLSEGCAIETSAGDLPSVWTVGANSG